MSFCIWTAKELVLLLTLGWVELFGLVALDALGMSAAEACVEGAAMRKRTPSGSRNRKCFRCMASAIKNGRIIWIGCGPESKTSQESFMLTGSMAMI